MAFLGWGHRSTPSKESSCSSCSVFLSFFLSFAPLLDGTELNTNECSNDCATRVCIVSSDQTARERFLSFFFFLSLPNRSLEFGSVEDGNEHEKIFQIFPPSPSTTLNGRPDTTIKNVQQRREKKHATLTRTKRKKEELGKQNNEKADVQVKRTI